MTTQNGPVAKVGRPTKLTQDTVDALCEAVSRGETREEAAKAAGIATRTLQEWLQRRKAQEVGPFRDLVESMRAAEQGAETGFGRLRREVEQLREQAELLRLAEASPEDLAVSLGLEEEKSELVELLRSQERSESRKRGRRR